MNGIDVIHRGTKRSAPTQPQTTVTEMARSLDLSATFAARDTIPLTIIKLARELESVRYRLDLLEAAQRRRWWHPIRDVVRRWRSR
jgi:hypothetical protein